VTKPTKVIASALGLSAFSTAVTAGIASGNLALDVLFRALVAMFVCYLVGLLLGMIGERTVDEHVRQYVAARVGSVAPPAVPAPPAPDTGGKDGGKLVSSSDAG
jgi:hypothetical protein